MTMIMTIYFIVAGLLTFFAGLLHGGREAMHAQPRVFEDWLSVSSTSFFGSQSWLRKYVDCDPNRPVRKFYTGISDYWHVAAWMQKMCIIAAILIAVWPSDVRPYWIIVSVMVALVESAGASVSYKWLRYRRLV